MLALVDCNNFYASCERIFRPDLEGKPIVVLSNNDGCVIARSKEAKDLEIPMGAPFFKIKEFCQRNKVNIFSSNYKLYGDISRRVMKILETFTPHMKIYSIDEAFLDLSHIPEGERIKYAIKIRLTIQMYLGISVGIGIGKTKTLAKVANKIAKKEKQGAFDITNLETEILQSFPVGDIWGIGSRTAEKLNYMNIYTGRDFKNLPAKLIRQKLGVVGERIQYELNGISCLKLEDMKPRKNIVSSGSFGRIVTNLRDLEQAVALYATRACNKLRGQDSLTKVINIFVQTNRFEDDYYHNNSSHKFANPTENTLEIISAATGCMHKIFKPKLEYKKAGIILMDLFQKSSYLQPDFLTENSMEKSEKLMKVIDSINQKYGKLTVSSATTTGKRSWYMKADNLSKAYTTNWMELKDID